MSFISNFQKSKYFVFLKILFSVSLLTYFLVKIDYSVLAGLVVKISVSGIAVMIISSLSRNFVGGYRFYIMIDKKVPLSESIKQYFVVSYYNNFLPTAIGGDAVRIYILSRFGINLNQASAVVFTERFIGFYSLISIAYISAYFWNIPTDFFNIIQIIFFVYSVMIIIFLAVGDKIIPRFRRLQNLKQNFANLIQNRKKMFVCFLVSVVFQLVSVFISYFIGYDIGLDLSVIVYLSLVPLVWLFTMLPISFGGVGLREISFIFLFMAVGASEEESLLISLGTYFSLIISSIIGFFYSFKLKAYGTS